MAAALARAEPAAAGRSAVEQIEKIVRDYLMREPEVIYEALQELQRQRGGGDRGAPAGGDRGESDEAAAMTADPVGGNPEATSPLVEFFDYHCGYCRRVVPSVRELLDEDATCASCSRSSRCSAPDSVRGCARGTGGRKQDGYVPFHFALMASDDLSLDGIHAPPPRASASTPERLEADMDAPEVEAR